MADELVTQGARLPTNTVLRVGIMALKRISRYWPYVKGIRRSPIGIPHEGPVTHVLMIPFMLAWTNCWINSGVERDFRHSCDVIVMDL